VSIAPVGADVATQRVVMMQSLPKPACNDALHKYSVLMDMSPQKFESIRGMVRDRMIESGIDNYAFIDDQLQIGSMRYAVQACGCGEPGCDGLRLSPVGRTGFVPTPPEGMA
jgi:hypothetical protein